ncbi:MAG: PIN domain-containing protein [Desulfurococcales archaeon]|nr:PIN domain-containing protein [Desulfurococcales archaeon]
MDLAVDTNIVFSSLTRSRRIQRALVELHRSGYTVHAPRELIEELRENIGKLQMYSPLDPDLLNTVVEEVLPRLLTLHSTAEIPQAVKEKAKKIVTSVDPDDWPFVALAIFLDMPLWTGDKGLLEMSAETKFKHFVAIDTEGVELLLRGVPLDSVLERMKARYLK